MGRGAAGGGTGTGAGATGTLEVTGGRGAGGSVTGEVLLLGAGGGRGADGSWIGAVALRAGGGAMLEVVDEGTWVVAGPTGAVASRGWVTPAPGRARSVMRTVSFFSGTALVLGVEGGGGVGWFSSLIKDGAKKGG